MGVEIVEPQAHETLAALREVVRFHQYDTVYRVHCYELSPRWLDTSLRETLPRAPEPTRALLRLLYFQDAVERRVVERVFGADLVARLGQLDLLDTGEAETVRARVRLEVIGDTLLLVEDRQLGAASVYYGEDSQFLRHVLQPRRGDVCLDLCTGSGVQALRCAPLAERVDAVDVYPRAARLAALNAALNGLADRVAVHAGDLWAPLPAAATYDHVTSNPPLMPVPEGVAFPLFGHGGADGLDVVRRIVAELPRRLTARGRATLIGACTGDARTPAIVAETEAGAARALATVVFLLLRMPLRDWVRLIADTVQAMYPGVAAGRTIASCRTHWGDAFERTFVYTYLLSCERGEDSGCRVFDYSTVGQKSYWFVNRGRVAH